MEDKLATSSMPGGQILKKRSKGFHEIEDFMEPGSQFKSGWQLQRYSEVKASEFLFQKEAGYILYDRQLKASES